MIKFEIIGKPNEDEDIEIRADVQGTLKDLSKAISQSMVGYPEVLQIIMESVKEYEDIVDIQSSQN